MTQLPERLPCDCGIMTVCRKDGVPTCYRCQEHRRKMAQTWVGQEPVVFKMDGLIKWAKEVAERDVALVSPDDAFWSSEIIEAFEHDTQLKYAMENMRYEDWRRLHPHKTKQELKDG